MKLQNSIDGIAVLPPRTILVPVQDTMDENTRRPGARRKDTAQPLPFPST
jgi:hypothetical protein